MELERRALLRAVAATSVLSAAGLAGCSGSSAASSGASSTGGTSSGSSTASASLSFDPKAWHYDATNDVYWQLGASYVAKPAARDYETLGVYVPGAYLKGTKNADGTYTATVNGSGSVGGFTARTAPIVFPVNTPGYAAQKPPTSYSYDDASSYLKAGFVYVHAGLRGRDSTTSSYVGNAPWGVTDLKAAVRYVRYNAGTIPGSTDRVFVFGHSGGGAQSSVMGASGDSPLFTPYLETLGAAMSGTDGKALSDSVAGVMAWCPITSLDYANAAYEWNMGQFASTGTRAAGTWTKSYSDDLARSFVGYINTLGLKDSAGTTLTLSGTNEGIGLSGSYYDHVVSVINTSLNDFLSDTTFPYTPSTMMMAGMGGAPGGSGGAGGAPSGGTPPGGAAGNGTATGMSGAPSGSGGVASRGAGAASSSSSTTYPTVAAYIEHLNSTGTWVSYDAATKTAKVADLQGFVKSQKNASKDVGAFDGVARGETENVVLGIGTSGLHFAPESKTVIAAGASTYAGLSGWKSDYAASAYTGDFATTDGVGKDVPYRLNMYNPMYYLCHYYDGYKTSTVAPHWRIRTGIMQGDTANTVEINLALALRNLGIDAVDFATVWGEGHTMAERTGSPVTNFIRWVTTSVTTSSGA